MTVLTNPVFLGIFGPVASVYLKLTGWKVKGEVPDDQSYICVVAPHTSNWDFPVGLAAAIKLRIDARWIGKHTLFKPPFGGLMRSLGGIGVDRSAPKDIVQQTADWLNTQERVILAVTPEGTRSKVERWKTGFYRIAEAGNIPIILAYIDFGKKEVGIGPIFERTGNLETDILAIQEFYSHCEGRNHENQTLSTPEQFKTSPSTDS